VHEFEALTASQLEALVRGGATTAIVPFGSIEHQGDHLPLGADALLADAVGRDVALRLGALLLPTVRVGDASQHASLMGTLTLRATTLSELAFQVGESLARAGVRVIALVSTHGGNGPALKAAAERLNETLGSARACAPRGDVGPDPGKHAGDWLTSAMLELHPELVRSQAAVGEATAARGAEHIERFVASIVAEVGRVTLESRGRWTRRRGDRT
jgi:creatinine amidohydrolase